MLLPSIIFTKASIGSGYLRPRDSVGGYSGDDRGLKPQKIEEDNLSGYCNKISFMLKGLWSKLYSMPGVGHPPPSQ